MDCSYKVYYNNSYLLISGNRPQMNEKFARVMDDASTIEGFINQPEILFNGSCNEPLLIVSPQAELVFDKLRDGLKTIAAGGGMVWNEHRELLMIFRRGMWDLPKGKIERNETIEKGAVREVVEETGVQIAYTQPSPVVTYHAYALKGKNCLKQTSWFTMQAVAGQQDLIPQTEEDIEEVRWVKPKDFPNYRNTCYPLIWDLIKELK